MSLALLKPVDGATVASPVRIESRLTGLRLTPAGTLDAAGGHLHILVDSGLPTSGGPIVVDAQHVDIPSGASVADLYLTAGPHTLQLVLGDGNHVPFQPLVASNVVTVTVAGGMPSSEEPEQAALDGVTADVGSGLE